MSMRFVIIFWFTCQSIAQTSFIREGSIGQIAPKTIPDQKGFETLQIKDWEGQKFIFLPKSKKLQVYGYQLFEPKLAYDKWVGKILTVTDVKGSNTIPEITFLAENGQTLRAKAYSNKIDHIAPLRDLEYARSKWLGKTLWIRDKDLSTWDESTQEFGSVKLKKYSPVVVEDVVAGWYDHTPIRIILRTKEGEIGFQDVNVSGTNISARSKNNNRFDDTFFEEDPRKTHDWPDEIWRMVENGEVAIGMTSEQSRMSWGKPKSTNRTVTTSGISEQWVYNSNYLYFEDGKLTAIQN